MVYSDGCMTHREITILRVRKSTRDRLRRLAIAGRESYDEIINRLLEPAAGNDEELEKKKQRLLKIGVSKQLVEMVGILPKTSAKQDRELIVEAIGRWVKRKGMAQ
jgi:hypothetical protein